MTQARGKRAAAGSTEPASRGVAGATPLTVNGWTLFAHPQFLAQTEALAGQVERLTQRDPAGYRNKNATKRLAAIVQLAFETIPQDPARAEYRQGNTLGAARRHWFRAKFFQQYRLFYRFHAASRIIVFAWVHDDDSLRAYDSGNDAYRTFGRLLNSGNPPDDWDALLAGAKTVTGRLKAIKPSP